MLLRRYLASSASTSRITLELMVLLGVTYIRLGGVLACGRSEIEGLKAFWAEDMFELDYNQLKRLLLRALADTGPMDSSSLFQNLTTKGGADRFEIHAVRMALVRYYRQGLLKRIRSGGQFKYTLSNRGVSRLKWLEEKRDSGAG